LRREKMAKGTSGYLKPKKQTIKEIDEIVKDKKPKVKDQTVPVKVKKKQWFER
jgi:hypothetical protein